MLDDANTSWSIQSRINSGRGLAHYGSGFGYVTGASALTHHTSWTSRSPTEEKLETSDEHGVGRSQCQRSPPGNNCMHIRGIRLSGLGATSEACAWLFCCVSAIFLIFYICPGKWKGADRSWQVVFYSLPELSHRLPAGQFEHNMRQPV